MDNILLGTALTDLDNRREQIASPVMIPLRAHKARIFDNGRLVAEIIAELWPLSHDDVQLRGQ